MFRTLAITFTGIDDPYEEPLNPETVCYTAKERIEESVAKVIAGLESLNYISSSVRVPWH